MSMSLSLSPAVVMTRQTQREMLATGEAESSRPSVLATMVRSQPNQVKICTHAKG